MALVRGMLGGAVSHGHKPEVLLHAAGIAPEPVMKAARPLAMKMEKLAPKAYQTALTPDRYIAVRHIGHG